MNATALMGFLTELTGNTAIVFALRPDIEPVGAFIASEVLQARDGHG